MYQVEILPEASPDEIKNEAIIENYLSPLFLNLATDENNWGKDIITIKQKSKSVIINF